MDQQLLGLFDQPAFIQGLPGLAQLLLGFLQALGLRLQQFKGRAGYKGGHAVVLRVIALYREQLCLFHGGVHVDQVVQQATVVVQVAAYAGDALLAALLQIKLQAGLDGFH